MHKKPTFCEVHMLDSLFLAIYNIVSFRILCAMKLFPDGSYEDLQPTEWIAVLFHLSWAPSQTRLKGKREAL